MNRILSETMLTARSSQTPVVCISSHQVQSLSKHLRVRLSPVIVLLHVLLRICLNSPGFFHHLKIERDSASYCWGQSILLEILPLCKHHEARHWLRHPFWRSLHSCRSCTSLQERGIQAPVFCSDRTMAHRTQSGHPSSHPGRFHQRFSQQPPSQVPCCSWEWAGT